MSSPLRNIALKPFSALWESVNKMRRAFYEYGILKKDYFKVPIISIGNITFGGTGKTPTIIWLLTKLESYGLDVAILTRGYKGQLEHKSGMIKGGQRFLSNPHEFGDEPLLISKKMSKGAVIVGKKRAQNLKKYFPQIKPDVVLLDDGFQHIQLYRSFNIVLFDALLPIDQYKTAPLGYLREGLTSLKDADAILISRADQVEDNKIEELLEFLGEYHRQDITIGKLAYEPYELVDCFDQKAMELSELSGKKVVALTAIASPQSFYNLIESFGGDIVEKLTFSDHYFFTHEDVNNILHKCIQHDAIVLTSEKDMVKLRKVTKDNRFLSVNIGVKFISGEVELLTQVRRILNLDYS